MFCRLLNENFLIHSQMGSIDTVGKTLYKLYRLGVGYPSVRDVYVQVSFKYFLSLMAALISSNFLFQYKDIQAEDESSTQENTGPVATTSTVKRSVLKNRTNTQ